MFSTTLDTKAVKSALVKHLTDVLGLQTAGKDIEVSVTVGRKSADKPVPEITATVEIYEEGERTTSSATQFQKTGTTETPSEKAASVVTEASSGDEIQEAVAAKDAEAEEPLDDEDVEMPKETKPFDAEDDTAEKGEGGLFD